MRELAYYEAKFEGLEEIMAADQRVHLINGTFLSLSPHRHVYQKLRNKYADRMISPPISELGFCGLDRCRHGRTQADCRSQHRQLHLRSLAASRQRSCERVFHVGWSNQSTCGLSSLSRPTWWRRGAAFRQPTSDAVELPRTGNRHSFLTARRQRPA